MTRPTITPRMKVDALLHRVFLQFGVYLRDSVSGEEMKPGAPVQFDHIHCTKLGGPNVYDNIRPLLVKPHQKKTRADLRMIKKTRPGHAEKFAVVKRKPLNMMDALRAEGLLARELRSKWPSRKMQSRQFEKRRVT